MMKITVFVFRKSEWYHSMGVGSTSHSQQWGTSLLQQTAPSIPHLVATASACQKRCKNIFLAKSALTKVSEKVTYSENQRWIKGDL